MRSIMCSAKCFNGAKRGHGLKKIAKNVKAEKDFLDEIWFLFDDDLFAFLNSWYFISRIAEKCLNYWFTKIIVPLQDSSDDP